MKRALVVLAVLGLVAAPVWAQSPSEQTRLRLDVSGTVITLGDPFAGDFSVMPFWAGKGPLGKVTAQSFYLYQGIDPSVGQLVCRGGQIGIRFESTGDMLLLNVDPGLTGTIVPVGSLLSWEQDWTGTVIGGTGRFQGATGTFTKRAAGILVLPGLVQVWEGTAEIVLDKK
jgi:hypothetical protein